MAKVLAEKKLEQEGLADYWEVDSAGLAAISNQPANENAIMVMDELGIDLRKHKSKSIPKNIEDYDLILTMTKHHKQVLLDYFPVKEDNVFTVKEFASGNSLDIIDPFGSDKAIYRETAKELSEEIDKIIKKIKNFY
jgi:protein-tyrosine-phosphatase